jgi:DNA-binding transcriptional MerR regulator
MGPHDNRSYSIGDLAKEFKVTPRALRFYEDKDLLHPARDGMNRIYSSRDRARLQLILRGKRVGFSLSDIREILDLYDLKDNQRSQLKLSRVKFREQIKTLEAQREDLEAAIEALNHRLVWIEERLAAGESSDEATARAFDAVARSRVRGTAQTDASLEHSH